ncbi:MAG: T9SS type A sorting domain-containing protein [Flavobacteriaceae bacterium]|nr:T9SS type A sorting domain-containing protein [Flavobacteriaceae bacterium]
MKKLLLFVLLLMGVAATAQVANTPPDIRICDQGTIDGFETFELTVNDSAILGGQNPADYIVTYHLTLADAQVNLNVLPTFFINSFNPQSIGARVTETATGNFAITSFNLEVVTAPQAFPFTNPLTYCDTDNDNVGYFDLTITGSELVAGQSNVNVEFYEYLAEANQGVGAINTSVLYENINTNADGDNNPATQTIYAVLIDTNSSSSCTTTVPVNLVVQNAPVLPSDPLIYAQCEEQPNITDGLVVFDLVSYESALLYTEIIASGGNIAEYSSTYHTGLLANGSPNPISIIANPSAFVNVSTPNQVIYAQVENTLTGCTSFKEITLQVYLLPAANHYLDYVLCEDDYYSDMDGVQIFDLPSQIPNMIASTDGLTITFYEVLNLTTGVLTPILASDIETYENISNPQDVFVQFENAAGCSVVKILKLTVNPNPTPLTNTEIIDTLGNGGVMTGCEGYVYGQGAIFDLTQWEVAIIDGEIGVSANYYTNYDDARAGINAIATPATYNNISNQQTIYVSVINDGTGVSANGTGCQTIVEFDIKLEGCELPQDNLTVETISETCVGVDNGMIQITATEAYTYEVSVSLNGNTIVVSPYTFTDVISIPNLASGTYYVCVTATEVNVTQCYDVYVDAVEDLTGFSGRMGNVYRLTLTGSKQYNVSINDVITEMTTATATETITFEYELSTEVTTVKVTTNKECQGRFEEIVLLDDATLVVFPNPVQNELRFSSVMELSSVVIYDMTGKVVLRNATTKEMINVAELMKGVYFIKATSGTSVYTSKFIKK